MKNVSLAKYLLDITSTIMPRSNQGGAAEKRWDAAQKRETIAKAAREEAAASRKRKAEGRSEAEALLSKADEAEFFYWEDNFDLISKGLPGVLNQESWCKCRGCSAPTASAKGPVRAAFLQAKGPLSLKGKISAELELHGINTSGKKVADLKTELRTLALRGCWYLSPSSVATPPQVATPAPAPAPAPAPTPPAEGDDELENARAAFREAASANGRPGLRPRKDAASECHAEKGRTPLPDLINWIKVKDDPAELQVYTIALQAIVNVHALRFEDYQTFAVGRGGARLLVKAEWRKVTDYAVILSDILLDDYLFRGQELSIEVHRAMRDRKAKCWEDHWPHGWHVSRVRAVVVDTCWPTPGYTSQHGTTHMQDYTTNLVLAVAHLTKHPDPHKVHPLYFVNLSTAPLSERRYPHAGYAPSPVCALFPGVLREHGPEGRRGVRDHAPR